MGHAPFEGRVANRLQGIVETKGERKMNLRVILMVVVLALVSQAPATTPLCAEGGNPIGGFSGEVSLPQRVLHFPPGQSVGQVHIIEERHETPEVSHEFHPGYVFVQAQHVSPAQGDVVVPAGKRAFLHMGGPGVTRRQCLDCLKSLNPGDIQGLDFTQSLRADDTFLPHIARLTGLSGICPVYACFSGQGWTTLQTLTQLEHICTPYGLTDSEMAGIATLQTVNEMEIVATKLTDAGLASIAKMRNLQVLHLDGTPMMTDEGLKVLATLPKLRHLRLSGLFTDKGLAHLAAAPSLKVMWLETPRATEEGLHHLARIQSLERLCVPWLDQITDRSMAHLQSMPKLKALGVGDAWRADAGIAALATLANLEVLALKGGPALTDDGLKPLASMPKLRALQVYNSRITEKGLASLARCKMLDSIEIRSTVRIDEQAVARLRAELPKVQTLDISRSESQARARPLRPARAMLMR
jgi:hypothetical protein